MGEHHEPGDGLEDFLFAETPQELLGRWDAGDTIASIQMSTIGPSYEQVIQIIAFEMLRSLVGRQPADDEWGKVPDWIEKDTTGVTEKLGPSGAQIGEARTLANAFYTQGHRNTFDEAPVERQIKVCKDFPQLSI